MNEPTPLNGAPGAKTSPREDGWYWVRKMDWNNRYEDWVPALWQNEFRSWRSAMFSGIPDSEMIVGDRLQPPVI